MQKTQTLKVRTGSNYYKKSLLSNLLQKCIIIFLYFQINL